MWHPSKNVNRRSYTYKLPAWSDVVLICVQLRLVVDFFDLKADGCFGLGLQLDELMLKVLCQSYRSLWLLSVFGSQELVAKVDGVAQVGVMHSLVWEASLLLVLKVDLACWLTLLIWKSSLKGFKVLESFCHKSCVSQEGFRSESIKCSVFLANLKCRFIA